MNERAMQFRLGMFVIVAGMVLTMLIVWFEAPSLLRQREYVTVFFPEAPGVDEGIPVRKSGVLVGEVFSFEFTGEGDPEGVLVTLAIDPEYAIRPATVPRLGRAIIGDVSIDLLAGAEDVRTPLILHETPEGAAARDAWIDGQVAIDPMAILGDVSQIFDQAGDTMAAIELAATTLAEVSGKVDDIDVGAFLSTWEETGRSIDQVADEVGRVLAENEDEITPAVASLRRVAEKVDTLLDDETTAEVKRALGRIRATTERLDRVLARVETVSADLAAGPGQAPKTNLGQALFRANRIAFDVSLLTAQLSDERGRLNTDGTLQRLVADPELYNELRILLRSADATVNEANSVLRTLKEFASRISNKPSLLSEGILNGR